MMIDLSPSVVSDLRKLLTRLSEANLEMGDDLENQHLLYDTPETMEHNTDPLEFTSIDRSDFILADKLKQKLKL